MPSPNINEHFKKTRIAGATLGAYIRVKMDTDGTLVAAAGADHGCGFLTERGATSGEPATYICNNAPEFAAVASQAISIGSAVFGDASGKVTDVSGAGLAILGTACTAAAADGDIITIEPGRPLV